MNYACLRVIKWLSSQAMVGIGTKNNILDYLLCVKSLCLQDISCVTDPWVPNVDPQSQ